MHGRDDADVPFRPGEDLPFEDRGVEAIACGAHVAALPRENRIRFLLECRRALKPRGLLRSVPRSRRTAQTPRTIAGRTLHTKRL
jgi:ubiquinone/menaquinone biosynthesis C-methylase UbiE